MITQDLLDYIENEMAKNTPKETIESNLVSNGWNAKDVAEGFAVLIQKNSKPVPPPVVNSAPIASPATSINQISIKPTVPNANPISPADHIDTNVDLDSAPLNSHQYAMPAQNLQEAVTQMMTPPVQTEKSSAFKIIAIIIIILAILGSGAFAYFKYFAPATQKQNTNTQVETTAQNFNIAPIDMTIASSTQQVTSTSSTSTEENITLTGSEEPEVFLGTTTATTSSTI